MSVSDDKIIVWNLETLSIEASHYISNTDNVKLCKNGLVVCGFGNQVALYKFFQKYPSVN
jgi:hypothetical protein